MSDLDLSIELEDLSGRTYRLSAEERRAWDVPAGLSFDTRRGEGHAQAGAILTRPITRDFPDLGLLHTMRVIAPNGEVVSETRVSAFPRSSGRDAQTFSVVGTGYMSHAADRTFQEVYVDCDLSRWRGPGTQERLDLIAASYAPAEPGAIADVTTGQPALELGFDGDWNVAGRPDAQAWYDSPVAIGSLYYAWKKSSSVDNTSADWNWRALIASGDRSSTAALDNSGNLRAAGPGTGTVTATTAKKFALVDHFFNTLGGLPNVRYSIFWTMLAVYGAHGLTKRGTASATAAQGFYVSDMIENIVSRFCPGLSIGQIDAVSYVVEQAAFLDPITPYDAINLLNQYHLYDFVVWEDRKFHFTQPKPLDDWDWEIRLDDPETEANLQGDSIENVANGIVVTYTDLFTQATRVLTPETNTDLADDRPENPANLAGIDRWADVTIPHSTVLTDAIQIGRAHLAEFSRAKAPGELTVGPYVRDRQGNRKPAYLIRAGDRLVIADHPNDAPRRINDTSYDDDAKRMRLSTDLYSQRMEAYFARIAQARSARGI